MKDSDGPAQARRTSQNTTEPAIQVICLGSGGGPSEDNVTGFLVRSTASKWAKNSMLAVDAGSHLAAITRILENDFPLVSQPRTVVHSRNRNGRAQESPSPGNIGIAQSEEEDSTVDSPASTDEAFTPTVTTVEQGPFKGLEFPHASARANALHVVRDLVSTYLITHPHLDHLSGFVINTAAFHNTSRPKRLAALPFTVNAIKTHIFNNMVWPNLTDEDGGVGLVTFQRLAEGGNIALGEGLGRGYIEVCDGLGVKGFKVSHGHCMRGPSHVHRGSNANIPETPGLTGLPHSTTHGHHHSSVVEERQGRSLSFSLPSQPGTPLPLYAGNVPDPGRAAPSAQFEQCVIDSTAYFIRTESSSHTSAREVLIFGDVEPDSLSLSPRTAHVWAQAAPKIATGTLTGIFIECSYNNSQGDAVLYGHLGPRHLIAELQNLADMVKEARKEHEKEKEEARKGRKRKRASHPFVPSIEGGEEKRKASRSGHPREDGEDESMTEFAPSPTPVPGLTRSSTDTLTHTPTYPSAPATLNLSKVSVEHTKALLAAASEAPLKGLKVVIIHVKDTLADGPLVGESILKELEEAEKTLAEQGKPLGCVFEISKSGGSYYF